MRLFLAIDVPDPVDAEIRALQAGLPDGFRLSRHPHITLVFIGECTEGRVEVLIEELRSITHAPVHVVAEGVGAFPDPQRVRSLYVPARGAESLSTAVREATGAAGRPYLGHITIARAKGSQQMPTLAFSRMEFTAKEFVLYRSILSPEGTEYVPLERFSLEG